MSKHTPGPWRISGESATIVQADNRAIGSESGLLIASANGYPDSGYFPSEDQAKANALLIAAAPDLLEALEALRDNVGNCICYKESASNFNAWEMAAAAIAKAKGEQL